MVGNDEGRGSNGGGEGDLTWVRHFVIARVRSHSWAVVFVRARSSALVRVRFRSRAVAFVRGGWPSFVGGRVRSGGSRSFLSGLERSGSFLSVRVCSWAVLTLTRCGGGGGPLVGGGGGPLVVGRWWVVVVVAPRGSCVVAGSGGWLS